MATTTLNLPCVRFVKRVTNGALLSKYSYLAMMSQNAEALKAAPWRASTTPPNKVSMPVNKVTETDAKYDDSGVMISPPSFTAFTSDAFDAYQQGGDARREDGTMCGYAGCVAYRFKIPTSAAGVALSNVALVISRDRYCRAGVRVALALSNDVMPSNDWSVIRGTGANAIVSPSTASEAQGVASWGFLGQSGTGNLLAGRAAEGAIEFNASSYAALRVTGKAYLWVYLTLEDYNSYWTLYNGTEPRYYSIEGSARLVSGAAAFTFAGTVTSDAETWMEASGVSSDVLHARYIASSVHGMTEEMLARYGNAARTWCASAVILNTARPAAIAHAVDRIPGKPMFGSDIWPFGASDTFAMPVDEMNTIAGLRVPLEYDNYWQGYVPNHSAPFTAFDGRVYVEAKWIHGAETQYGLEDADGNGRAAAWLAWQYRPYMVNGGKESYRKMKVQVYSASVSSGMECDVLVWKTVSKDAYGPYCGSAFAALASNGAFFTGSTPTISGTFTGDGTDAVNVTATATLIKRLDFAGVAAGEYVFDLDAPVMPGDVLILVPTIRPGTVCSSYADAESYVFNIDQPMLSFA